MQEGRLEQGDLVEQNGVSALVIKVGTGQPDYSIVVFTEGRRIQVWTKVRFWMQQGSIKFHKTNDRSIGWAKGYAYAERFKLPEVY